MANSELFAANSLNINKFRVNTLKTTALRRLGLFLLEAFIYVEINHKKINNIPC